MVTNFACTFDILPQKSVRLKFSSKLNAVFSIIKHLVQDKKLKIKNKKKERKRDIVYRQVHCLMNKAVSFTSLPPNLSKCLKFTYNSHKEIRMLSIYRMRYGINPG